MKMVYNVKQNLNIQIQEYRMFIIKSKCMIKKVLWLNFIKMKVKYLLMK